MLVLNSKWLAISIASLALSGLIGFIAIRYLENRAFQSRIQIKDLQKFITFAIQNDMKKAVDIGIIGFSLREGVIIEDLKISREEDFSSNENLLHSKKIVLKLSSLFQENPYIRKIRFIEPRLSLNTNDPYFSKMINFALDAKIQEIEFINADIEIYQRDKSIVKWSGKTNWYFKKEGQNIRFKFSNSYYWLPWGDSLRGEGNIFINQSTIPNLTLKMNWNNIQAQGFPGFIELIGSMSLDSGKLSGNANIEYNNNLWNITAINEITKSSGHFIKLEEVKFRSIDLMIHSFVKINNNYPSSITEITQSFSTNYGTWNLQWKEENNLYSGSFKWDIPEFSNFSESFTLPDELELSGRLYGDLKWEESGNRNQWFQFTGNQSWENGGLIKNGIKLDVDKFNIDFIKPNELAIHFKGRLYDSPWIWNSNLKLQFWKSSKADGNIYYPVGSLGSISGNLDLLLIQDWKQNLQSSLDLLEKDFQERKKKLILADYFTEFPIYRLLLEEMNISWNFDINNVKMNQNSSSLPDWNFKGYIKQGSAKLELHQNANKNKLEFNSQFSTKLPYIDFRMHLEEFPLQSKFSKCGIEYSIESMSVDLQARSLGADSYNLYSSGSVSSSWELNGLESVSENGNNKESFSDKNWFYYGRSNLRFNWNYYGETNYYNNIEFIKENGDIFKGNGVSKGDLLQYSFYGKIANENTKFSLEEDETECRLLQ